MLVLQMLVGRHLDASRFNQRVFFAIFLLIMIFFSDLMMVVSGDDCNLTNSTPRIFLRRDIFVQVISMQFPGLWNSATGFLVAIWTVR